MRDVRFIWQISFVFLCFRVGEFDSNEIDVVKVTWHFWSISIERVDDVSDKMFLLCFAQHEAVDKTIILDAHEDDTSVLVIKHTTCHWWNVAARLGMFRSDGKLFHWKGLVPFVLDKFSFFDGKLVVPSIRKRQNVQLFRTKGFCELVNGLRFSESRFCCWRWCNDFGLSACKASKTLWVTSLFGRAWKRRKVRPCCMCRCNDFWSSVFKLSYTIRISSLRKRARGRGRRIRWRILFQSSWKSLFCWGSGWYFPIIIVIIRWTLILFLTFAEGFKTLNKLLSGGSLSWFRLPIDICVSFFDNTKTFNC